jgi:diguanylate cyclase (GGDEF)-like protein
MLIVIVACFSIQLTGYIMAIQQSSEKNSVRLHATLLVHNFKKLRQQLGREALNYVRTGDESHRQNYRKNLAILDTLDSARYKPAAETWTGFYSDGFTENDPTKPMLQVASHAQFQPAEAKALNELIQIIRQLTVIEQSAMDQVASDGVSSENLLFVSLGPDNEDYQERVAEADSQLDTLHDMLAMNHHYAQHKTFDHVYWLISLGLIQATILLVAVWFGRTYMSQLEYRAFHDSLTNLPNRRYVELHLNWACTKAEAYGNLVILAFIDLNAFKPINDTLGHDKGDYVLKYIAENLRANCRPSDMAFRYGGDEFLVVFVVPANQRRQSLERLENLIRTTFSKPCQFCEGGDFGAAVGISVFPSCAKTSKTLIQTADQAMYRAKHLAKTTNESLVIVEYQKDFAKGDHCAEG